MPSLLLSLPFRWLHYGDVAKTAAHDFCRRLLARVTADPPARLSQLATQNRGRQGRL